MVRKFCFISVYQPPHMAAMVVGVGSPINLHYATTDDAQSLRRGTTGPSISHAEYLAKRPGGRGRAVVPCRSSCGGHLPRGTTCPSRRAGMPSTRPDREPVRNAVAMHVQRPKPVRDETQFPHSAQPASFEPLTVSPEQGQGHSTGVESTPKTSSAQTSLSSVTTPRSQFMGARSKLTAGCQRTGRANTQICTDSVPGVPPPSGRATRRSARPSSMLRWPPRRQ